MNEEYASPQAPLIEISWSKSELRFGRHFTCHGRIVWPNGSEFHSTFTWSEKQPLAIHLQAYYHDWWGASHKRVYDALQKTEREAVA